MADKAYSSRAIRHHLRRRGIRAVIPVPADQAAHRRRRGSGKEPGGHADRWRCMTTCPCRWRHVSFDAGWAFVVTIAVAHGWVKRGSRRATAESTT
ncbi:hypothetical protein [Streptomyces tanashiensis]